uniref:Uncharacterized protein n=1 Tax=Chromera velia CCMP2878 TaxID=1169474 RepID=A0A0G4GML1_9ALVE|eukprot:Cvel_22573.t1-p1 / transcript=Cvel_22573.t1 / gene=Cvel_22573 / organism=Chromera_velia_CCMP2878 / gene_product=hypothetical protein / transcript_product=hypothetical protein / location=Cvel_scaffold2231:2373-7112(-) / protein_length=1187 / sequence_SO=supercontig / SO=protein_coding / is_pseudo=false
MLSPRAPFLLGLLLFANFLSVRCQDFQTAVECSSQCDWDSSSSSCVLSGSASLSNYFGELEIVECGATGQYWSAVEVCSRVSIERECTKNPVCSWGSMSDDCAPSCFPRDDITEMFLREVDTIAAAQAQVAVANLASDSQVCQAQTTEESCNGKTQSHNCMWGQDPAKAVARAAPPPSVSNPATGAPLSLPSDDSSTPPQTTDPLTLDLGSLLSSFTQPSTPTTPTPPPSSAPQQTPSGDGNIDTQIPSTPTGEGSSGGDGSSLFSMLPVGLGVDQLVGQLPNLLAPTPSTGGSADSLSGASNGAPRSSVAGLRGTSMGSLLGGGGAVEEGGEGEGEGGDEGTRRLQNFGLPLRGASVPSSSSSSSSSLEGQSSTGAGDEIEDSCFVDMTRVAVSQSGSVFGLEEVARLIGTGVDSIAEGNAPSGTALQQGGGRLLQQEGTGGDLESNWVRCDAAATSGTCHLVEGCALYKTSTGPRCSVEFDPSDPSFFPRDCPVPSAVMEVSLREGDTCGEGAGGGVCSERGGGGGVCAVSFSSFRIPKLCGGVQMARPSGCRYSEGQMYAELSSRVAPSPAASRKRTSMQTDCLARTSELSCLANADCPLAVNTAGGGVQEESAGGSGGTRGGLQMTNAEKLSQYYQEYFEAKEKEEEAFTNQTEPLEGSNGSSSNSTAASPPSSSETVIYYENLNTVEREKCPSAGLFGVRLPSEKLSSFDVGVFRRVISADLELTPPEITVCGVKAGSVIVGFVPAVRESSDEVVLRRFFRALLDPRSALKTVYPDVDLSFPVVVTLNDFPIDSSGTNGTSNSTVSAQAQEQTATPVQASATNSEPSDEEEETQESPRTANPTPALPPQGKDPPQTTDPTPDDPFPLTPKEEEEGGLSETNLKIIVIVAVIVLAMLVGGFFIFRAVRRISDNNKAADAAKKRPSRDKGPNATKANDGADGLTPGGSSTVFSGPSSFAQLQQYVTGLGARRSNGGDNGSVFSYQSGHTASWLGIRASGPHSVVGSDATANTATRPGERNRPAGPVLPSIAEGNEATTHGSEGMRAALASPHKENLSTQEVALPASSPPETITEPEEALSPERLALQPPSMNIATARVGDGETEGGSLAVASQAEGESPGSSALDRVIEEEVDYGSITKEAIAAATFGASKKSEEGEREAGEGGGTGGGGEGGRKNIFTPLLQG